MKKAIHSLCTTSVYLCMGVMEILGEPEHEDLYQMMADKHSGHCGMVSDIIYLADYHEKWFKDRGVDYEDMTDGVYDYEVLEDELSVAIVEHIKEHEALPTEKELFDILDNMLEGRKQKDVTHGPVPGGRLIDA